MSMDAHQLKAEVADDLLDTENVTGVGVGLDDEGNKVVVVNVEHGTAHTVQLPDSVNEEDVEIRETGSFEAEVVRGADPEAIDRKAKHRPVPGGVSAGHVNITAGTTGFLFTDGSEQYATSNNHVYADVNEASSGDNIVQPGPTDGGTAGSDKSGELAGYIEITDGAVVDLAWMVTTVEHKLELAELGKPAGDALDPQVGDVLVKSGRTTGVTEGEVQQVDANISVGYGDAGTFQIDETIITGSMSQGGDSGSAVLHKTSMRPAGILFAGSDSATAINLASNMESESGLSIVTGEMDQPPTASVEITLIEKQSENGVIEVSVVDESGNSVSSAEVVIEGPVDRTSTTGSSGTATFTDVPVDDYTVVANKTGYESGSSTVSKDQFS